MGSRVIDGMVNVLKQLRGRGEGGLIREANGLAGLFFGGLVDFFDLIDGEDLFFEENLLPDVDRILTFLIVANFFFRAIPLVIGICDGVAVVAVGKDLEDRGAAFVVGPLDSGVCFGAYLVEIFPVNGIPFDFVALCAGGESLVGEDAGAHLAGAHGIPVIFNNVDYGDVPEAGEVEGFVKDPLIDCSIAEVADGTAAQALVFEGVGESQTEGGLARDNAVAAPVALVRRKVVHGATFSLGAARKFAKELSHTFVHTHPDREGVAVVTVGGDDMVMIVHDGDGSDGRGLLADVKVEESSHFPLLVGLQSRLFKLADADHVRESLDFAFFGHGGVNGILRILEEILFAEGTRFSLIKGLCFRCLITHFQPFRKSLMGEIYLLLSKQKLGQSGMNVEDSQIVRVGSLFWGLIIDLRGIVRRRRGAGRLWHNRREVR